jgi:dephospho-CoA kinase
MSTHHRPEALKRLVGVVGGAASGKDTVADIFVRHGYSHVSSSDLVREEIARRGLTTSRELQTEVANELRRAYGANFWLEQTIRRLGSNATKGVVSGLYSPGEGKSLKEDYAGILVSVVVGAGDDSYNRFERLRARSSGARDELSYDEFIAAHKRESGGTEIHETNLATLHEMADFVIYNSSSLADLESQTTLVIKRIEE